MEKKFYTSATVFLGLIARDRTQYFGGHRMRQSRRNCGCSVEAKAAKLFFYTQTENTMKSHAFRDALSSSEVGLCRILQSCMASLWCIRHLYQSKENPFPIYFFLSEFSSCEMQYKTIVITSALEVGWQGRDDSLNLPRLAFGVCDHHTERSYFHVLSSTFIVPPLNTGQLDVVWLLDRQHRRPHAQRRFLHKHDWYDSRVMH